MSQPFHSPLTLLRWPSVLIPPSSHGDIVLLQFSEISRTQRDRKLLRTILRSILNDWARQPVDLLETDSGPVVADCIQGKIICLSIAYANHCAWVAFRSGEPVGIDAISVAPFDHWKDVAALYLDSSALGNHSSMPQDFIGFARAWTCMEASLKAHRLPLRETIAPPPCSVHLLQTEETLLAVALPISLQEGPQPFWNSAPHQPARHADSRL